MPIIGIIGGRDCSKEEYKAAMEVGSLLAKAGVMLICGGMGGIMEAACKGAIENGGTTIGILPTDTIHDANPYVSIPIATGFGTGRNIIIARTAEALIAICGKYGTLSEIAYGLQFGKPVIALYPWIDVPGIVTANSPREAVNLALHN